MIHALSTASQVIHRLLDGFRKKPALPEFTTPPTAITLRHILPVTGRRRGGGPAFTLLVGEMSTAALSFRTAETLAEGDRLNIEMLLQGFGPVCLEGRVHRLVVSPSGYQGELLFSGGEGDRVLLDQYLRRQAREHR